MLQGFSESRIMPVTKEFKSIAALFVIPASFSVILPMLRDSESLLKKDSGQARMTNGQAGMTELSQACHFTYELISKRNIFRVEESSCRQVGTKDYKNPPLSPFFKGGLYNPLFGKEGLGRFYKYVFSGQALNKLYAIIRGSCHV